MSTNKRANALNALTEHLRACQKSWEVERVADDLLAEINAAAYELGQDVAGQDRGDLLRAVVELEAAVQAAPMDSGLRREVRRAFLNLRVDPRRR
jgi:hypothetical protein